MQREAPVAAQQRERDTVRPRVTVDTQMANREAMLPSNIRERRAADEAAAALYARSTSGGA